MEDRSLIRVEYTQVNGGFTGATERIIRETELNISVNERHFATAMIMSTMEKEFVIGQLFGQRVINSTADIASIIIKDNNPLDIYKKILLIAFDIGVFRCWIYIFAYL